MRWLLSQRWDDLLFAHWQVEPRRLRALLPRGIEPDVRDGAGWIGVVAFEMTGTRGASLFPARGLGPIPELNVRTYVRVGGERGVWFLSLDTSSPLFVTIGRTLYGLRYRLARMLVVRDGPRIHYTSTHGPAAFAATYEPVGPAAPAAPGSLEHWLFERYRLFALRGDRLVTAAVAHPRWTLQPVEARIELNSLDPPGVPLDTDPLFHFSRGVPALIAPPEQVTRTALVAEPHGEPARAPRPRRDAVDAGDATAARVAAPVGA